MDNQPPVPPPQNDATVMVPMSQTRLSSTGGYTIPDNPPPPPKRSRPRGSKRFVLVVIAIILLLLGLTALVAWQIARQSKEVGLETTTLDLDSISEGQVTEDGELTADVVTIRGLTNILNDLIVGGNLTVNGESLLAKNLEVIGQLTAANFTGSGADLTNINADNITSGTLDDARLSANVALLNRDQVFTGGGR